VCSSDLEAPEAVALGEVGLDYHYGLEHRAVQLEVFESFTRMAARRDVPLMMHVRDAHEDCLRVLDQVGIPPRGGVIHCFTAGPEQAAAYLARGLYLSIPGVVTFKNAAPLRAAVPHIPPSRLLVETDCPYLAPVPMRGKRNEPAFVAHTAAAVAALSGRSPAEVAKDSTRAAQTLFALPIDGCNHRL
jgi:TatD DNase family protein